MNEFRAALQRLVSANEYEVEDEEDAGEIDEAQQRLCLEIEFAKALLARPEPTDRTEPFCWVIPGDDNADANGMLDASVDLTGEFTRPLYAHPRPEPEPRITREEAETLLESWHEQRLWDREYSTSLNTGDHLKEACLAAMLRPKS